MEEYIGVKFITEFIKESPDKEKLRNALLEIISISPKKEVLAKGTTGNISLREPEGMIISATGAGLNSLKPDNLVEVVGIDENKKKVYCKGSVKPSSESIMHWLIYRKRPDVNAIIHSHISELLNDGVVSRLNLNSVPAMEYGTIELANAVSESLKNRDFVVLEGHGIVSVGQNIQRCIDRIDKYRKLATEL